MEMISLPHYVFSKPFDKFLVLPSETIIPEVVTVYFTHFLKFLHFCQTDTKVLAINSNSRGVKSIDYALYPELIEKYSLQGDVKSLAQITESPELKLISPEGTWEYYSNSLFNVSLLGYEQGLSAEINEIFINNECIQVFQSIDEYLRKSDLVFPEAGEFVQNLRKNYGGKSIYS